MRGASLTFALIFMSIILAAAPSRADDSERDRHLAVLKERCVKCHGGQKTKGDLNLQSLIDKGILFEDLHTWEKILLEVQSENMPPDDEEEPLKLDEKEAIVGAIFGTLGAKSSAQTRRMLTPDEFKYSVADIFEVDLKNYDPIGDLYPYVSHDHDFYTVNNTTLMNVFYYNALIKGVEQIANNYNEQHRPIVHKKAVSRMRNLAKKRKRQEGMSTAEIEADNAAEAAKAEQKRIESRKKRFASYAQKEMSDKAIRQREAFVLKNIVSRRNTKSTNHGDIPTFPMKMAPMARDCIDGYFEYARDFIGIRAKSWRSNMNVPIDLHGGASLQFMSFVPGTYRLTFKASGHDRAAIANFPAKYVQEELWNNDSRLLREKCRLTVFKTAKFFSSPKEVGARYTPIKSIYIDDDVATEYTIELSSQWNFSIGILFENGIVNLKQAGEDVDFQEVPDITFNENEEVVGYVKAKKPVPTIRLYDITLDKVRDHQPTALYIADLALFDDAKAKEKIRQFIKNLHVGNEEQFVAFFDLLRGDDYTVHDAFKATMKSIAGSAEFLYLNTQSTNADQRLRHASYSLTKSFPSPGFTDSYRAYRSGKLGAGDFTKVIVQNDKFRYFIESFARQWLKLREMTENPPDRARYPTYYEYELKDEFLEETYAFLHYLFRENRKIAELVDADYAFINDRLARVYGIDNISNTEVARVEVASGSRMGVISQASFMAATSNGVEDLPFRRAKWIVENILDKRIPPPPDSVDVTGFVKAETKSTDFASRIEAHLISKQCVDCHKHLDPIAIPMHSFDILGHRKEHGASARDGVQVIDAIKKQLTTSERKLASAFTKNLLCFSTGRPTSIDDLILVKKILDDVSDDGFRTRDIFAQIINHRFPKEASTR